ncbi:MAG: amidohydrolase family protein [Candidatus Nanopelagicales bacterium]
MIIDAHCHVWPDRIAARALAGRVPGMMNLGDGTVAGALESIRRSGIDRSVVMGIADQARHVDRTNEFIGSLGNGTLIPFGTVHPDLPLQENIDSLRRHHVVGVKLHPLFQGFSLDDSRVYALLEAFGSEVPVITHVGAGGTEEANRRSNPRMLADIVRTFPDLRLVACHFGGFHQFDEAEREVVGLDVYLETSWPPTLAELDRDRLIGIIEKHGTERVVFGSDWPMADPRAEIHLIRDLGFDEASTANILGLNLARFLDPTV